MTLRRNLLYYIIGAADVPPTTFAEMLAYYNAQGSNFSSLDPAARLNGEPFMYEANVSVELVVDAAADPVGVLMSSDQGLVVSAEQLVNGSFAADTDWAKGAGITIAGGEAVFTAAATTANLQQNYSGASRGVYRVEVESVKTSGNIRPFAFGPNAQIGSGLETGTFRHIFGVAAWSAFQLRVSTGPATHTVQNVSLKRIAGNHASQGGATARPVLAGDGVTTPWSLTFDGTTDFYNTPHLPTSTMVVAFPFKANGASQCLFGGRNAAGDQFAFGTNASGFFGAAFGSQDWDVIYDLSEEVITGTDQYGLFKVSLASGAWELWRNSILRNTGVLTGNPPSLIELRLGARNNNGTSDRFFAGSLYAGGKIGFFDPTEADINTIFAEMAADAGL